MFSNEILRDLYRHMEWADARVWAVVLATDGAERGAALRDTLLHIHGVQRAFPTMWNGQPPSMPQADQFPDLVALRQWARPCYGETAAFLEAADPSALTRPVEIPGLPQIEERLSQRLVGSPTVAETAFQVTSHSTHHRGQVNRRLRELGGEPPPVDYIAWVWVGKPIPAWPVD